MSSPGPWTFIPISSFTSPRWTGDVDGDGELSVLDSLRILRKAVGISEDFENKHLTDIKWYKQGNDYFAETSDGKPLSGLAVTDGYKCGFDKDGMLLTGKSNVDGEDYEFLDNGILLQG